MSYQEVINDLSKSINHKHNNDLFKESIINLKTNFGQEVSTKFLKGLSTEKDFRKRTKRISYLLRTNKLKTKRSLRFYKEWVFNKYHTDINEYAINKAGQVYLKNVRVQGIGRDFITNTREVLFMIKI